MENSVELYLFPQDYDPSFVPVNILANTSFTQLATAPYLEQNGLTIPGMVAYYNANALPTGQWGMWSAVTPPWGGEPYSPNPGELYFHSCNCGGLLQIMTGAVIGGCYEISLEQDWNPASGSGIGGAIDLSLWDGNSLISGATWTVPASVQGTVHTYQFTSTTSTPIISMFGGGTGSKFINVSITFCGTGVLGNGQVLLDLYNFQQIPLTLSVDNFQNAAEKTQSYSKAFKVPGTKRNNRIFKNLFDVTATLDLEYSTYYNFNPYLKTHCTVQEDGILIFEGFLKMLGIDNKEGEIIYNVNLYSDTIQLADILKDKKFYDLDFQELKGTYIISNIEDSWDDTIGWNVYPPLPTTSFAYDPALGVNNTNVLKMPFVDWTHGATVCAGGWGSPCVAPFPEFSHISQMFRPWIQCRYILKKMFADAGYSYTSVFFDSADFQKLFMDFNWGQGNHPNLGNDSAYGMWCKHPSAGGGGAINPQATVWASSTETNIPVFTQVVSGYNSTTLPGYNESTNVFTWTGTGDILFKMDITLNFTNVTGSAESFKIKFYRNRGLADQQSTSNQYGAAALSDGVVGSYSSGFYTLNPGDTFEAVWYTINSAPANCIRFRESVAVDTMEVQNYMSYFQSTTTSNSILQNLRGELGQWEFLKGLITMFNLVTIADPTNNKNIIIEPYDTVFPPIGTGGGSLDLASRGITKDWTGKMDISKINLKPMTKLKKYTEFGYDQDKDDYCLTQYASAFGGYYYGDLTFDASGLDLLIGTTKIIAKPFAPTITKSYDNSINQLYTPAIYKVKDDGTSEGFDNKPRILYNCGIKQLSGQSYYIPSWYTEPDQNATSYLQFSGFTTIPITPTSNDLGFGTSQILEQDNTTVLNLYNRFYANYYRALYNADTRTLKMEVKLSPADINQFHFSDIVMIVNRAYRVNKIDYKPGELAKVEFILIP